jgi:hypothetical protein
VFVAGAPGRPLDGVLALVTLPAEEVRRRLDADEALLGRA